MQVVPVLEESIRRAAVDFPTRAITVFDGRGRSSSTRTFAETLARGVEIARGWLGLGVVPGDRILIAMPTSWDWIDAWIGALMAGALPIAAPPGGSLGTGRANAERIEGLVRLLRPRFVLLSETLRDGITSAGAIVFEELASTTPVSTLPPSEARPEAFLQLTSGTSGRQRAVEISGQAAVHNALALNEAIMEPLRADGAEIDTVVSWLPLHHDMGLIGCFLLAVLTGRNLCLLPPQAFLAKPQVWLEQIAARGSVLSLSPNFGYQLCVDRLKGKHAAGLDLSNWRAAVCGAEMIRPATVASLESACGEQGFRREAFRSGYGLAEATAAVTLDRKGRGVRTRQFGTQEIACVGEPMRDTEICVAAPNGVARGEGQAGEVLVRGPAVFKDYFNDPRSTRNAFKGEWLRTGDLGFLHQGELYLTGRIKELLIVRGQNIMPQELEWLAESAGDRSSRAAAFSVTGDTHGEQPILVVETMDRDREALQKRGQQIRDRVGAVLGLPLMDLLFVRRGRIPKTSSGKIRRAAARELYMEGRLTPEGNS
jgi:fatty-acyl-CoA synthase